MNAITHGLARLASGCGIGESAPVGKGGPRRDELWFELMKGLV